VPPNAATAIEYGTARPTARMRVGNISAYAAGRIATPAPMSTMAIAMATPSCTASRTIACNGNSSAAVPTELISRTGRRPIRSDSAPQAGWTAMSTRLARTPASNAALEPIPRSLIA
jgi:hypothetical protein